MAEFNLGRVKGDKGDPWKIPIGFEYWQSPNGKDPKTLFGEENWLDVSKEYENAFIRVKGDLNPTGAKQEEGLPNIEGKIYQTYNGYTFYSIGSRTESENNSALMTAAKDWSVKVTTGDWWKDPAGTGIKLDASRSNKIYGNSTHVTPLNYGWTLWRKVDPSEI